MHGVIRDVINNITAREAVIRAKWMYVIKS